MFSLLSKLDQTPQQAVQRLVVMYVVATAITLASLVAAIVLTDATTAKATTNTEQINMSGRQLLLRQRILYLAHRHHNASADETSLTKQALAAAVAEFEQTVTLLKLSHPQQTRERAVPDDGHMHHASNSDDGTFIQPTALFIEAARSVLADRNNTASLAKLRSLDEGDPSLDLDQAVARVKQDIINDVSWIRRLEQTALTVVFTVIVLQLLLVFLPGHRLLRQLIASGTARDRQLHNAQTALDLTKRALDSKNAEIEKEQDRLSTALGNAAALCREQAAFTYSVSHDLKSPANTLQLVLDELIHEHAKHMSVDGRDLLSHAQESISLMSVLIEDVLQYSWATDPNEAAKTVDLHATVNDVSEKLHQQISSTDALVTLGNLHQIKAAPRQVNILVHHLLSNALTFQPEGQIPNVHISSTPGPKPDTIVLRVQDNGIGIAPEDHDRVFGLFQRLHLRDTYPGSGLGLATCHRIAANHSGKISVHSALQEGCIFEVTLGPLLTEDEKLTSKQAA